MTQNNDLDEAQSDRYIIIVTLVIERWHVYVSGMMIDWIVNPRDPIKWKKRVWYMTEWK